MINILSNPIVQKIGQIILIILISIVIYKIIEKFIKKALTKTNGNKVQRNNIIVFTNLIKYIFVAAVILIIIFTLTGSFEMMGISAGLLSAALGWALQRPITGVAAWIMVLVKKPFQIGDRIMIGDLKGDVTDMTLTHVYMEEIGGTLSSEENSKRIIMIPNSILFEQKIVNYTLQDEFIIDEAMFYITYDSDIDKMIAISKEEVIKANKDIITKPYVRTYFSDWGVKVFVRYASKAMDRVKRLSDVSQGILKRINKEENIKIAYPRTDVRLQK